MILSPEVKKMLPDFRLLNGHIYSSPKHLVSHPLDKETSICVAADNTAAVAFAADSVSENSSTSSVTSSCSSKDNFNGTNSTIPPEVGLIQPDRPVSPSPSRINETREKEISALIVKWLKEDKDMGVDIKEKIYHPFRMEDCNRARAQLIEVEHEEIITSLITLMKCDMENGIDITLKKSYLPFTPAQCEEAKARVLGTANEGNSNNAHSSDSKDSSTDPLTFTSHETLDNNFPVSDWGGSVPDADDLTVDFSTFLSTMTWADKSCGCIGGLCIDNTCSTFRAGKECGIECWNPLCKNKSIQETDFPNHRVELKGNSSSEFQVISEEKIAAGQGISPLYGTVVLVEQVRDHLLKTVPNLSYLLISNTIAVEFTNSGTTAKFVQHSCHPNAEFVIKELPSGELVPLLQAKTQIEKCEEITVDYARHSDPKLFQIGTTNRKKPTTCNCGAWDCRGFIDSQISFDLSTLTGQQLVSKVQSIRLMKNRMNENWFKGMLTSEPHRIQYTYTRRSCQYCRFTGENEAQKNEIGHCVDCNVHLCPKHIFIWHSEVESKHLIAIDMHGREYFIPDEEARIEFIHSDVDARLKNENMRDELCPQHLDKHVHAKVYCGTYKKRCMLCRKFAGVCRCITCNVLLCESCWYDWHPNADPICVILPSTPPNHNSKKTSAEKPLKKQTKRKAAVSV